MQPMPRRDSYQPRQARGRLDTINGHPGKQRSTIGLVRVGILTGGGDCPGLNAVLRAVVRKGERFHGDEIIGFKDAWDGVREGRTMPLTIDTMRGSLPRGGTVLGTKRGSPFDQPGGVAEVHRTFHNLGIDALIVVGGNGSLTVANALADEEGLPIIGVPKTIDNDVVGTDVTFGFHTAVQIATEAIDRLHTTAESHDRVMVVEVMGRHSGWIAAYAGIAGGASVVLIPEIPFDIEKVCVHLARRHEKGRYASIVVVSEGAEPIPGTIEVGEKVYDKFGHVRLGGIADVIAREVGERTGFETRVVMLGHVQRGGTPTAFDRVLFTRFGVAASDLVHEQAWGQMVALRGTEIVAVPLADTVGKTKPLDMNLYHGVAEVFFS
jgi:ATP-dependent phosphofructokinase / diphosphate-dependent phosphofructokinase